MKIAWCTDIHLNFCKIDKRQKFYREIKDTNADAILITGDIGESQDFKFYLNEIKDYTLLPVYFVLGNHDYYGSSYRNVQSKTKSKDGLTYLHKEETGIALGEDIVLFGVDGWGDCVAGDFEKSSIYLTDHQMIADYRLPVWENIDQRMYIKYIARKLADSMNNKFVINLDNYLSKEQGIKTVLIGTHVPPFEVVTRYNNLPTDSDFLPFYCNKTLGEKLKRITDSYKDVQFKVYAGHTHCKANIQLTDNLYLNVGEAEYMHPEVAGVIEV